MHYIQTVTVRLKIFFKIPYFLFDRLWLAFVVLVEDQGIVAAFAFW